MLLNRNDSKGSAMSIQKLSLEQVKMLGFLTCTVVDYLWPTLLLPFPLQNGLAELKKKK